VGDELEAEPVHQRGKPPRRGSRIVAAELSGRDAVGDDALDGLDPGEVELGRNAPQGRIAQGLTPGVDPQHPTLLAPPARQVLAHEAVELFDRVRIFGQRFLEPPDVGIGGVAEGGGKQVVLGLEVVVDDDWPNRGVISVTTGMDDAQRAFENCQRGIVDPGFAELYLQSTYDPTLAPPGKHTLSAFVQYASYTLADGTWDERRDEIGRLILDRIARFAPDIHECVGHAEVLGPPDIEARIGLTKGHIFQGETMPDQMWTNRLTPRTPIPGVYLCGAATHPAGSVIALNGRNAAMTVLDDASR
jgi:hypothetical protein